MIEGGSEPVGGAALADERAADVVAQIVASAASQKSEPSARHTPPHPTHSPTPVNPNLDFTAPAPNPNIRPSARPYARACGW